MGKLQRYHFSSNCERALSSSNLGCSAGDHRVTRVGGRPASAAEARAATGFAIGGIPPLGHEADLPTIIDESLSRFDRVWCAAGTPHAVFEARVVELLSALPSASIQPV